MFTRIKKLKTQKTVHEYLQIVESYREEGKPKQRVIATLGRMDRLLERGRLDGLIESLSKFSRTLKVVKGIREGAIRAEWAKTWGTVAVFEKLWRELGLRVSDRTGSLCLGAPANRKTRL